MSNSSESPWEDEAAATVKNCVVMICNQPAAGVGSYSRQPMCSKHLDDDGAKVRLLQQKLQQQLEQYSKVSLKSLEEKEQKLGQEIEATTGAFAHIRESLAQWETKLVGPLQDGHDALKKCIETRQDMLEFDREVAAAEADGNLTELCKLVKSMEIDMSSLVEDFEGIKKLPKGCTVGTVSKGVGGLLNLTNQHLMRLQESSTIGSDDAMDGEAADSTPSSVVQLDNQAMWVATCEDASGFVADASGRVVHADSASPGSSSLPKAALFVSLQGPLVDHLVVTSLDGAQRFRCHCDVNFGNWICGLHCHDKELFIAQKEAVTVTDLSGKVVRKISSSLLDNDQGIRGIGGDATRVFISGGDTIAEVNVKTGKLGSERIKLGLDAKAQLGNLTVVGKYILVRDLARHEVHKICLETREVMLTYPTLKSGLQRFQFVWSIAADSRGRFFVSDGDGHTVYCMTSDGSVAQVFGSPGNGGKRLLSYPYGVAVTRAAAGESGAEKLLVADWGNKRLLVFDLR